MRSIRAVRRRTRDGWTPGGNKNSWTRRSPLLEERRRRAIVVEPEADGEVDIGERVSVRELRSGALIDFRVVGIGEADPDVGDVSHESPIGSALLGRRAGEIVEVPVPNGAIRLEVLRVHD